MSIIFDRAVEYYDETRGFPPGQEIPAAALVARVGKMSAQSRVLEVGIGTGRIALPLARHVREIVGVDLSRGMMGKLRGKQTNEVIHLIEGDATRLPLPDSSFDAVVAVHVFHLIPTWREAVQEVARVLRPDGVLVNAYGGVGTSQMWAIWDAVRNEGSKRNVGIQNIQQETFLAEIGWQSAGGKQTHTYKVAQTPRSFIERIANRTFSNTWRMSDEELSDILDKVRAAALEQFGDLDASIERDTEFIAEAYTPPSA